MNEPVRKPKEARKRKLQDEKKTSTKRAKIGDVVEKTGKYKVSRQNANSRANNADNVTRVEDQNEFNGQSLRTELSSSSSTDGLNALRKFVTICNENATRNLAAEYLLAGGSVLEVLRLLDSEKKNISSAVAVFSAVNILFMKILAEYPQYRNSTVEACRYLLNSHMSVVYSMLSPQSNVKQRRVVLKMLTAIVSLDNSLSRELLIHLSLQRQTLENLVQHTKPRDPQNVRTCFIHFVLAFLVEGSVPVIRTLLDKHYLLSCIFFDMQYDSRDVVTLVLTVVKEYVLENSSVNKTTKMHVFSTNVVLSLVSLYNWKGPNNWTKGTKNKTRCADNESEEFLSDKEVVTSAAHEFLIILLTSHRHGIIFHDRTLGTSRNKHNQLLHTVLQNLEKPWEHKKPSDLVVRIMVACPDLIRSQYNAVGPFLEPRVSSKWICLLKFVEKIITSIDTVNCMKTCASELSVEKLRTTLLSLIVPGVLVKTAILPGLDHDDLAVRHEVLILLLAMIQQIKTIFSNTKEFYCRIQMTNFVLSVIPNVETILQVWKRIFEADANAKISENVKDIEYPEMIDHLDVILSVLSLYKDVCPESLDSLTYSQSDMLLSNLNSLRDDKEYEGIEMEKINRMKVKAIQFLLAFDFFAPKEKTFKNALLVLIRLIHEKATPENLDTIKTLLNATGLFEGCEDQLDIWINGFLVTQSPEELTPWFMSVLKSAVKHANKYIDDITQAEKTLNNRMTNLDVKRAEDIINELFDKADKILDSSKLGNKKNDGRIKYIRDPMCDDKMKLENKIDRLLDKINLKNCSFNVNSCSRDKVSSASVTTQVNGQNDSDTKETDFVPDNFCEAEFNEENLTARAGTQSCAAVSPLLYCALKKIKKEKNCSSANLAYLSYVTVHTLHHQVVPDLLVHLATDLTDLPVYKYLQSWSSDNQPISLKKKLPSLKLTHKISNMLLTDSRIDMTEFAKALGDDSTCRFEYDDKEVIIKHSLSLYDSTLLLRMTVFYLAQLAQRGILRQAQKENCELVLVSVLNIAQSYQENKAEFEKNIVCIFAHPVLLRYFSPFCRESSRDSIESMITRTVLKVSETVVSLYEKHDGKRPDDIFFAIRSKFISELKGLIIEANPLEVRDNSYEIAIELLEVLQLSVQDIASLLPALVKLEESVFISSNKQNLSVFGRIVPILLDMYCSKSPSVMLSDRFVKTLSLHLVHLKTARVSMEKWEEALTKYLSIFPRDIVDISSDIFALLLARSITKSTIRLIALLIGKNTKLIPSVVKHFLKIENAKQQDIVFPILGSNLTHKWNEKLLRRLYKCYSKDIAAYLTEPQNPVPWIEENTTAIAYLIENTFDVPLCERICDVISQSGNKLDLVSVCFVQLLESLYKRYESLMALKEKPLMDLIMVLLHVATLTLKKESKNMEKLKVLCEKLDNAMIRLRKIKCNFIFASLCKSNSWPQFTRFSLKFGLKNPKDDRAQINILKTLSILCDIAYEDNTDDEYAKTLFEMTASHSEFVNIMLGSSTVKGDLIELLRILTRKNRSVISVSHVPVYLAAYNATLSHVDQRILQILQHYESHNVKVQQYWPYLWGNAAATRYSIKGKTDTALWRQPSTSETFNLFDKDIVNETIKNYPVHRALKDDKLHENSNVYDPAFYLPLLCSLLAENNIVACHRINQTGALALVLASCCSSSSDVRMAAYTVISRYYFHLEASKSKEKLLWMRLIDVLRNGVTSLTWSLKDARLSCLVTTFLARTSLIASQPLHPLYLPLQTFLMAKAALDLNTIPELLQLLHSSHVEHKTHRHWILENIRDGMKEESDVDVALKCFVFKMLLGFYTSILSDARTKKLILEIIASATRLSRASLLFTRGYSMLPWLYEIAKRIANTHNTPVDIIMIIIENLLNSLENLTEDTTHYKAMLSNILLRLKAQTNVTYDIYA